MLPDLLSEWAGQHVVDECAEPMHLVDELDERLFVSFEELLVSLQYPLVPLLTVNELDDGGRLADLFLDDTVEAYICLIDSLIEVGTHAAHLVADALQDLDGSVRRFHIFQVARTTRPVNGTCP